MKFGVAIFPTAQGISPEELSVRAEERGFESLFFPEHTHIPIASQHTFPSGDGTVPEYYRRIYDPFIALTLAGSATNTILLGTGICLIVERDPITTAKMVATLDHCSGGRLLLGVGAGWNRNEMRHHGTDPRTRFRLMRERIEAMREIWSREEASYHGTFVDFDPMWSWPKPTRPGGPPILIGGNSPKAVEHALAYGDEWLPEPHEGLVAKIADFQSQALRVGRGPIPVTVYSAQPDDVETYRRVGVHRCVFWLPPGDVNGARRKLDELARILKLGDRG
jgi:probable F420-dependent oxidoreductase